MAGFIGTSNLIELRVDRRDGGLLAMDLGDGQRILAVAPEGASGDATITVRPEWIKLVDRRRSAIEPVTSAARWSTSCTSARSPR